MADFYPEVLAIPLHRFLGLSPIDPGDPSQGVAFTVAEASAAPGGYLHGGAVSSVLDVACFFALIPTLGDGEMAATVDSSVQLIRSVPLGARVELRGELIRRGRTMAFLRSAATVDGSTVATGQFTKVITRSEK